MYSSTERTMLFSSYECHTSDKLF